MADPRSGVFLGMFALPARFSKQGRAWSMMNGSRFSPATKRFTSTAAQEKTHLDTTMRQVNDRWSRMAEWEKLNPIKSGLLLGWSVAWYFTDIESESRTDVVMRTAFTISLATLWSIGFPGAISMVIFGGGVSVAFLTGFFGVAYVASAPFYLANSVRKALTLPQASIQAKNGQSQDGQSQDGQGKLE